MSSRELEATYLSSGRIALPPSSENVAQLEPGTASPRVTAAWIVCRGGLRAASGGVVACPAGRKTPIDDCLACPFLEAVEDERDPAHSCATDAAECSAPNAWAGDDGPPSSYALVIELL